MQEAAESFNVWKSLLQEEIKRLGMGMKQNWNQVWNIWRFFVFGRNGGAVGQSWQRNRRLFDVFVKEGVPEIGTWFVRRYACCS